MIAYAIGPKGGKATQLVDGELIDEFTEEEILYSVSGETWEDCVASYERIESTGEVPPESLQEMVTETSEVKPPDKGNAKLYLCEICSENFPLSDHGLILMPAVAWRLGKHEKFDAETLSMVETDRPTPVCEFHTKPGDVNWQDGCKEYLVWYTLNG